MRDYRTKRPLRQNKQHRFLVLVAAGDTLTPPQNPDRSFAYSLQDACATRGPTGPTGLSFKRERFLRAHTQTEGLLRCEWSSSS